jgi:hypothetical protein
VREGHVRVEALVNKLVVHSPRLCCVGGLQLTQTVLDGLHDALHDDVLHSGAGQGPGDASTATVRAALAENVQHGAYGPPLFLNGVAQGKLPVARDPRPRVVHADMNVPHVVQWCVGTSGAAQTAARTSATSTRAVGKWLSEGDQIGVLAPVLDGLKAREASRGSRRSNLNRDLGPFNERWQCGAMRRVQPRPGGLWGAGSQRGMGVG